MKASSGIELIVSLDRDSAVGLRAQLEHQLREGVRSGTLRHGGDLEQPFAQSGDPDRAVIIAQQP